MNDLIKNLEFHKLTRAFDTEAMGELLEEASRNFDTKSGETKKKSFAPSSFYQHGNGVCPRYWYYAFHGADFQYDNTARQRANMDSGTAAGERIAKLYEKAGLLNKAEFKVENEDPPIFGYGDLAVTWQGEQMIGEVKTTTQEKWTAMQATMKPPGYQLVQLLIYLKVMQKEKGFFVIENKNTHELLIIPVKMTPKHEEIVERIFEWMRVVKKNSDEDHLPTRPFTQGSWNCGGCPVKATCWAPNDEGSTTYRRGSPNDPNPGVVDLPPLEIPK
jgi:CRISPR/Cas system-associated exonuclease Cas4 (RecB family)